MPCGRHTVPGDTDDLSTGADGLLGNAGFDAVPCHGNAVPNKGNDVPGDAFSMPAKCNAMPHVD
jgi:hypothetical protein